MLLSFWVPAYVALVSAFSVRMIGVLFSAFHAVFRIHIGLIRIRIQTKISVQIQIQPKILMRIQIPGPDPDIVSILLLV